MQSRNEWPAASVASTRVTAEQVDAMSLPRFHGLLLKGITALSVALLAWLVIGEVDIVATAAGRVMPDGRLKMVQAAETGVILAIHGVEGQQVRKGDLLFEFDPTISESDQRSSRSRLELASLEYARIEAELSDAVPAYPLGVGHEDAIALQEQLRSARSSAYRVKLDQASIAVDSARNSFGTAQAMVGNLEEIAATARDQEEKLRPHVGQVVSRFSYESTRQALLDKQNDLATQRIKVIAAEGELQLRLKQMHLVKEEHRSQLVEELNEKRRELTVLQAEARKSDRIQGLKELRSPIDGQIQSVAVNTAGGVVTTAQTLATVVPNGTPLVIEANLSNADAGFVRVGQSAKVKLDAYPFMQYGALSGVVEHISPDSEGAPSVGTPGPVPSAYYRVRITTDAQQSVLDPRIRIKPGMTVQVDITTGRRRLIQFFIQPLIRYWDDTVSMR